MRILGLALVAALVPQPQQPQQEPKKQAPAATTAPETPPAVKPKVLLLIYDPKVASEQDRRLHEVLNYNDPEQLCRDYASDLKEVSGGFVDYQVVETAWIEEYPRKSDGFRYTFESLRDVLQGKAEAHQPDAFDYVALIRERKLAERVEAGELDEVWIQAMPYSGMYESTMAGEGAYFCNSDPVPAEQAPCRKLYVIMGFNYERGVGEMLEDHGHRTESVLTHVFGSWDPPKKSHAWDRFTLYEEIAPGEAACGNVHFAPNSKGDYDWGNATPVQSNCDDWLAYPNLTGAKRSVTCADWGNGDIRLHHKWWLARLPKAPGRTDGTLNHWWSYVVDMNRWPESNGRAAPAAKQ